MAAEEVLECLGYEFVAEGIVGGHFCLLLQVGEDCFLLRFVGVVDDSRREMSRIERGSERKERCMSFAAAAKVDDSRRSNFRQRSE